MICSLVMICSLAIYIVAHFTHWWASDIIEGEKPWFYELLLMKKDTWVSQNRGKSALEYIKFQRIIILLATLLVLISSISLWINLSQGFEFSKIFAATTILNIPPKSHLLWFSVVSSLLLPVSIVVVVSRLGRQLDSQAMTRSSTVVVEGITKNIDTKDNRDSLVNWWRTVSYTHLTLPTKA